jgi:hypothetical protein
MNATSKFLQQVCAVLCLAIGLSACTGEVATRSTASAPRTLSGFVGSPSLTDATVTLLTAGGTEATFALSGADARYSLTVEDQLNIPISIQVEGGTDLLTGGANSMVLRAISFDPTVRTLNVSHLSSLAALMAGCRAAPDQTALDRSWNLLIELSGLPSNLDPLGDSLTSVEVAELMRADVILAETLARARLAISNSGSNSSVAGLLAAVACDLDDDGLLNLSSDRTATLAIGAFRAAEAAVLAEFIAREPYVAGQQAATIINDALQRATGDAGLDILQLPIPDALLLRARADLALLLADFADDALMDILVALWGTEESASTAVRAALTSARLTTLWTLPARVALADSSLLSRLADRMGAQPTATAPIASLSASSISVAVNETVTLSWAATSADLCLAAGDWTGNRALEGFETTPPLGRSSGYELRCAGLGGISEQSVQIAVTDGSQPPMVSLSADDGELHSGGRTVLRWTSANATACTAAGGWSGPRAVLGDATTDALQTDTVFSLTCTGPGGSDTTSVTVVISAVPEPAPTLSFTLSSSRIDSGQSVTLSWDATNASSCQAADGWSGSRSVSGTTSSGSLTSTTSYSLTCSGPGGSVTLDRTVMVNPAPPPPAPKVTLSAADTVIDEGATTSLNWSSSDATECTASGGWSGSRSTSGSAVVGPLSARTTFSISCSGAGGSALAMVAISVNGTMSLSWIAPSENVDGSPLTDLSGYRVYYGEVSRNYPDMTEVSDPNTTNTSIALPSGDYYVVMTALDEEGNESAYSNEVLKVVP